MVNAKHLQLWHTKRLDKNNYLQQKSYIAMFKIEFLKYIYVWFFLKHLDLDMQNMSIYIPFFGEM